MARLSPGVCAVVLSCAITAPVAFAQQALPLVRRVPAAGPMTANGAVLRQQRVDVVTPEALRDPARSHVLTLDLFADVSLRAIRNRLEPTAHGTAWTGTLEAYPESSVVVVLSDGELMAHVYAPFGFFRIQRDGQGNYVVQQTRPDEDIERDDAVMVREAEPAATPRSMFRPFADSGSVIDVMVVYTRDALNGFGGEAGARAALDLVVTETNTALRNSNVSTTIRLVYSGVVEYTETGDSLVDLGRLQASTDGFLDDLHATRNRYAADLVTLVTERMDQFAGRGYVNSTSSTGTLGFSIVKRTAMSNGRTFAHELGHNIGAHHDWYVTQDPGAFPYSKGYVSLSGRFLDVMAYYNQCTETRTTCSQWLGYSNPRLRQSGVAAGVAQGTNLSCQPGDQNQLACDADNASTFSTMASVVARFRDSQTSITVRQILPGASRTSENGRYRLQYQRDGNLVLSDETARTVLWATNTGGTNPGQAVMQGDGNFVVYDAEGVARWASATGGHPSAYLLVQNDGNLVIFGAEGQPIWDRFR